MANSFKEIDICEYLNNRFNNELLIDIRDKTMFDFGSISGAINIPIDKIEQLYNLPKDKKICIFCQSGEVGREFAQILSDKGYDVYHLLGGYRKYLKMTLSEI